MEQEYTEGKRFEKIDFKAEGLVKGEYENCTFMNCNFSDADLSGCVFIDCTFSGCNLSLVKLNNTAFRDVVFSDCKMLGLQFGSCNEFSVVFTFDNCILNHSSFYKMKIKKTVFKNCKLEEVDLTEADLAGAVFENCDLLRATFDNTILEKADLRTAYNYSIDPEINRIKKAKFSAAGLGGLLDKYDIDIE
jgi:fluoroquinolone resistance protein